MGGERMHNGFQASYDSEGKLAIEIISGREKNPCHRRMLPIICLRFWIMTLSHLKAFSLDSLSWIYFKNRWTSRLRTIKRISF
jgi:hypothetical protein